ncbi:MAG: hypothetical protein HOE34_07025 [Pelagibacterales bacterium]|nr:hypothetical protein [Pelagibacterales bacterium]
MSKLSKIILSVFFLFLLSKNTLAIDFLECINDIPLNKSIIEKKDSCFLFDSDIGRIVSVEAESTEKSIQIEEFYKSILKQFGWILSSKDTSKDLVFVRDEEILKINIKKFLDKNLITYNSFLSLSIN